MPLIALAVTAAPASPPAAPNASPSTTGKRRGNPNLGLAARCGARTRGGCPCRAPAIRGKLRCRMHGGRSTGPRTEAGMARLRAARTVHGGYSAESRAFDRYRLTALRRGRVGNDADRYYDRLPPELAARLAQMPAELLPPPFPRRGLTPAQDRAVLRAEADALAPWKQAIAEARQAGRGALPGAQGRAHAPLVGGAGPLSPLDPLRGSSPREGEGSRVGDAPRDRSAAPLAVDAKPHAPVAARRNPAMSEGVADAARADGVAEAHAPERAAGSAGTAPAPSRPATPAAQEKAHAPEHRPAEDAALPAAPANRAERRRWKHLQRRLHRTLAACPRP